MTLLVPYYTVIHLIGLYVSLGTYRGRKVSTILSIVLGCSALSYKPRLNKGALVAGGASVYTSCEYDIDVWLNVSRMGMLLTSPILLLLPRLDGSRGYTYIRRENVSYEVATYDKRSGNFLAQMFLVPAFSTRRASARRLSSHGNPAHLITLSLANSRSTTLTPTSPMSRIFGLLHDLVLPLKSFRVSHPRLSLYSYSPRAQIRQVTEVGR